MKESRTRRVLHVVWLGLLFGLNFIDSIWLRRGRNPSAMPKMAGAGVDRWARDERSALGAASALEPTWNTETTQDHENMLLYISCGLPWKWTSIGDAAETADGLGSCPSQTTTRSPLIGE
ncbi:hypothetical protein F5I97DRAFT_358422 [Phlebopus sp. FC_14]|nr:hypothetical protein F5I97DRAFT_358422 [Phlebopus sp. FC_14]